MGLYLGLMLPTPKTVSLSYFIAIILFSILASGVYTGAIPSSSPANISFIYDNN